MWISVSSIINKGMPWKVNRLMSGHSAGGGRGGNNKDRFPKGMIVERIDKVIKEAYKNAKKGGPIQYSWQNGVKQARQFFQGKWGKRIIQFYYNHTTKTIETAWLK